MILKDLEKKMVFIGGPRQCGKTTLSQSLLSMDTFKYYNWDNVSHRKKILSEDWLGYKDNLIIFDELHKMPKWKNWLKGQYDVHKNENQFLITGSARLDVYRRGGDSLLGRYHYWRLHPFCLNELPHKISFEDSFKRLMTVGGFPEPFLDNDENFARRWRRERIDKIIKDDVRDLEQIKNIQSLELLVELLKTRVGGLISYASLAQDLQVAPKTVKHWIEILEKMYVIFTVSPYTKKINRSLQKAIKVYFYDNGDVEGDEGQKFENLMANHLLKEIQFIQDSTGYLMQLWYLRDKEGHEIDFVITRDKVITEAVECKWNDYVLSPGIKYFSERVDLKSISQVSAIKKNEKIIKNINLISCETFFKKRKVF